VRPRADIDDAATSGAPWAVMIFRPSDVDCALARTILVRSFRDQVVQQPERLAWTLNFVEERVRSSATIMCIGARMTACALSIGVPMRWWMDSKLPVLAEYTRLIRSLSLVGWFDAPTSVRR
jgi:hypothetical protein